MLLGLVGLDPCESVLYGWFGGPIKSLGSHDTSQSVGSGEVGLPKRPICDSSSSKNKTVASKTTGLS